MRRPGRRSADSRGGGDTAPAGAVSPPPARASRDARASGGEAARGLAARRLAAQILLRVDRGGAFADALLGSHLAALPDPADRRLVTRLVLGTLAWRGRLDYELARRCERPLARLDPAIRTVLRMGLFQLRILDRVPPHAAVDTAVRLARESGASRGAAGMVNAVLRRAAEGTAPLPDRSAGEIERLAVLHSHPPAMVRKFIEWFGAERAEKVMAADNDAAPNTVRLNLARGSREEILTLMRAGGMNVLEPSALPETAVLGSAIDFDSETYRAGLFTPQSEASQLVARMLAAPPGATAVDCAAAPGGKSTHLAEIVGPSGRVLALDVRLAGLRAAREVAARLGARNVIVARADVARAIPLRPASADFVLLDAPCTGIGTMRAHPEIRWRVGVDDFIRMGAVQSPMLASAAAIVSRGGVIVYSVCSFAPEEGPDVIRAFLATHPDFVIEAPPCAELAPFIGLDLMLRTSPDRGGLDGFFAARMRRL